MKKIFTIILALCAILTLSACDDNSEIKQIKKGCVRAIEIGQQYLDFEISKAEAILLLGDIEDLIDPMMDDEEERLEEEYEKNKLDGIYDSSELCDFLGAHRAINYLAWNISHDNYTSILDDIQDLQEYVK